MKRIIFLMLLFFIGCTQYDHENVIEITYIDGQKDTIIHKVQNSQKTIIEYQLYSSYQTPRENIIFDNPALGYEVKINKEAFIAHNIKSFQILKNSITEIDK